MSKSKTTQKRKVLNVLRKENHIHLTIPDLLHCPLGENSVHNILFVGEESGVRELNTFYSGLDFDLFRNRKCRIRIQLLYK